MAHYKITTKIINGTTYHVPMKRWFFMWWPLHDFSWNKLCSNLLLPNSNHKGSHLFLTENEAYNIIRIDMESMK